VATTAFDLVTPAATLFSGQAEMIVCKTVEGEIAFLADHEPYIGALDPCLVRILGAVPSEGSPAAEGAEIRLAVHGGFVEVKDNHVIMLADIAERPEDVDVAGAERDETDATSRVGAAPSGEPDKAAENDLKWAQARLEAGRPH
jgi:F-type H+-transporting ATPase subunit epsilon